MDEKVDAYKDLRVAVCSERRRVVLVSLNEGKKSVAALREELKSSPPALVHALRELEQNHFVRQDRTRKYELTPIGRSAVRKAIDFYRTMEALTKHEAFWCQHDLSGIPDHLFDRIGSLRDATLVTGTPTDVFKAMRRFVELLQDPTLVRLVSPIYIPDIRAIVLDKFATKETRIELVLTEEVVRHFLDEGGHVSLKQVRGEHLKLRVLHNDPRLVTLVTDHFMALTLYRTDGTFDHSSLLTSEDPEAIAWSQQLFDHYVAESADVVS